MKPIPKAALLVVKILRRDVKKPKLLPTLAHEGDSFSGVLRWGDSCPMGMHVLAVCYTPFTEREFPLASKTSIRSFGRWWDSIEVKDAKKAVDAIWGKSK